MIRGPHHRLRCAAVRPPSRFLFYSFFLLFKEPKKKKPTARKKTRRSKKKWRSIEISRKTRFFLFFFYFAFFFTFLKTEKKMHSPFFREAPQLDKHSTAWPRSQWKAKKVDVLVKKTKQKKNQIKTRPRIGVLLEMLPESPKLRKQSSDILQETKRYLAEEKKKKGTPSTAASSMITLRSWRYQNGFRGSIQVDAHFLSRFCHRIQSNDRDAITSLLWALIWVAIHSANEFSVPIPNF